VIDYLTGYERHLEAAKYFDEGHVRALAARIVDRTSDMAASMTNHALAEEGDLAHGRLDEIAAPTLVIHGTADPLFRYGHGEALARGIPRAELLPLEGVGHQLPPRPWWPSVIAAMLRHTSGLPGDGFADGGDYLGDPADRLCSTAAPTPWMKMPSAVNTAKKARRRHQGAKE
jgi:hypothetical protein